MTEALINTLADTVAEVEAETLSDTLADVKAEALLHAMADTITDPFSKLLAIQDHAQNLEKQL